MTGRRAADRKWGASASLSFQSCRVITADQWSSSTQYKYLSVVRGIQHSLWAKIVFSACAVQTLARFQATPPKGWSLTVRRSAIRPLQNCEFCYPHVFKAASRPLVC